MFDVDKIPKWAKLARKLFASASNRCTHSVADGRRAAANVCGKGSNRDRWFLAIVKSPLFATINEHHAVDV